MKFPFSKTTNPSSNQPRQPGQFSGRAPVYSYHSIRDSRLNDKPRGASFKPVIRPVSLTHRIFTIVGWIVFAGVLLFELWLKPLPKATVVSVAGTISRSEQDYQNGLNDIWDESILNHSKITIQTDKLSKQIKAKYPELADADIELPLLGQLPNVVLVPSEPVMLIVTQKGAFYLGADGKTLARTDQVTANSLGGLATVRDDSGLVPEPGKNGLPRQTITTIIEISRLISSTNLPLETLVLPVEPNQIDLVIKGSPYIVKLSLDQDPRQGIGALIALRDKFKADNINPTSYVDLRVPDKAFYK